MGNLPDTDHGLRFLSGCEYRVGEGSVGSSYATSLLKSLGANVTRTADRDGSHPDIEWARSGAMALTGYADGPPLLAPGPLAACANGALNALGRIAGARWSADLDGARLLGERAAILGLSRRGTISPNESCRLLRAADAWIAVNLARPDDLDLLPAWLGDAPAADVWKFVSERVAPRPAAEIVDRARLLGLAAAVSAAPARVAPPWFRIAARGTSVERTPAEVPVVIDLSSLWAGPLCGHLLGLAGARVIKLESSRRPDGARGGPSQFFSLINGDKASVALDFTDEADRNRLRLLLGRADIVIESARPRALRQLGVEAESLVTRIPGLTWVSITGYGRREPEANWIAFGDDAGVAAGLANATGGATGPPLFCGDAIADPLTGLHAALAALACWRGGGGGLLDLSLRDVTAHVLGFGPLPARASIRATGEGWEVATDRERATVVPPRARRPRSAARALGAETASVLREFGIPC